MEEQEIKAFIQWLRHNHIANAVLNMKAVKQDGQIATPEDILNAWKDSKDYNQLKEIFKPSVTTAIKPQPIYPFNPLDPKNYNQDQVYPPGSRKD